MLLKVSQFQGKSVDNNDYNDQLRYFYIQGDQKQTEIFQTNHTQLHPAYAYSNKIDFMGMIGFVKNSQILILTVEIIFVNIGLIPKI